MFGWLFRVVCFGVMPLLLMSGCDNTNKPDKWQEYAVRGAYSAALSKQSKYAFIGSFEHGGSLWEVNKAERLYDWNLKAGEFSVISTIAFSPLGNYAVTANQQKLALWDTRTGQSEGFWSSPAEILKMDLSLQGEFALLGLADHTAVYFDAKRGGVKRTFNHEGRVRSVALSDDSRLAITGSDAYKVKLWDVDSGKLLKEISLGNVVDTVALSVDKRYAFCSASLDQAVIWDLTSGDILHDLSKVRGFFQKRISYLSARFSPDSKQLLTGTASGLVQLWDVKSGAELDSWTIQRRKVYGPVYAGVYAVGFGENKYYAIGSNGILNVLH